MKPESRAIARAHAMLHPDIYREKMFNPLRGGTPDVFYMGYHDDLWVEWKYLAKLPRHIVPKLTPLQLAWLLRAHDRGRQAAVVVGTPDGCVILTTPQQWKRGVSRDEAQVLPFPQVARWIEGACGLERSENCPSGQRISTPSSSTQS